MIAGLATLALRSLTEPRAVAQELLSLRLGTEAIATALALAVVLNALVAGGVMALSAGPGLPLIVGPVTIAAILAALLLGGVLLLGSLGRGLGGQGRTRDVALLVAWLQGLRAVVQVLLLVLAQLSEALTSLLVLPVLVAGAWIFANFLDVAHGFGNLWKALVLLVVSTFVLASAVVFLFILMGVSPETMAS